MEVACKKKKTERKSNAERNTSVTFLTRTLLQLHNNIMCKVQEQQKNYYLEPGRFKSWLAFWTSPSLQCLPWQKRSHCSCFITGNTSKCNGCNNKYDKPPILLYDVYNIGSGAPLPLLKAHLSHSFHRPTIMYALRRTGPH